MTAGTSVRRRVPRGLVPSWTPTALTVLAWMTVASMAASMAAWTTPSTAEALEPDRSMTQYIRDEWGSARGYPGGAVHAITQSRDAQDAGAAAGRVR